MEYLRKVYGNDTQKRTSVHLRGRTGGRGKGERGEGEKREEGRGKGEGERGRGRAEGGRENGGKGVKSQRKQCQCK